MQKSSDIFQCFCAINLIYKFIGNFFYLMFVCLRDMCNNFKRGWERKKEREMKKEREHGIEREREREKGGYIFF